MRKIFLFLSVISFEFLFCQSLQLNFSDQLFIAERGIHLQNSDNQQSGSVSSTAAFFYSFILPGSGEYLSGNYSIGKYFTTIDIILWASLYYYSYSGRLYRDYYKAFAKTHANINFVKKDERYYATIGLYDNIYIHNNQKAIVGDFASIYDEKKDFWSWENSTDRKKYRSLWKKSEAYFNDVRFIIGGLLLNRLASSIYAAAAAKSGDKSTSQEGKSRTDFIITKDLLLLNLQVRF